jgi:hypothetical protein
LTWRIGHISDRLWLASRRYSVLTAASSSCIAKRAADEAGGQCFRTSQLQSGCRQRAVFKRSMAAGFGRFASRDRRTLRSRTEAIFAAGRRGCRNSSGCPSLRKRETTDVHAERLRRRRSDPSLEAFCDLWSSVRSYNAYPRI